MIIVLGNKAYRANRCIKMKEGALSSVDSPNVLPLVSINIKISIVCDR